MAGEWEKDAQGPAECCVRLQGTILPEAELKYVGWCLLWNRVEYMVQQLP